MPIPLRADFNAQMVRAAAKRSKDGAQARRLLALAAIYEGATRTEAAKIGGVTLQIVRDWVLKFNAHGPDGLIDRKPPGQPPRLNDTHRAALAAIIESGPIPAIHGVVRWRIIDLCQWIYEEFRVVVAKQTLSRELRGLVDKKGGVRAWRNLGCDFGEVEIHRLRIAAWHDERRTLAVLGTNRAEDIGGGGSLVFRGGRASGRRAPRLQTRFLWRRARCLFHARSAPGAPGGFFKIFDGAGGLGMMARTS